MLAFDRKVLILGYGSVSKCTLPILLKHVSVPLKNITILDFVDQRKALKPWIAKGVKFVHERITRENLASEFAKHVSSGGIIIDLAWNIGCNDIIEWCRNNKVLYINTSIEEWDPYTDMHKRTPFEKSLYYRHMLLREALKKWGGNGATTAVVDHGANPGLISHFTKKGIVDIAKRSIEDKTTPKKTALSLKKSLAAKDFPALAMKLGIKTIHVSERDTQITNKPKMVDEFVGTWSIEGLREEGVAPAEMGWGTHEKELPALAYIPPRGPKNQIFLAKMGMNTWVRSWIPHEEIIGMVIRHGEAFTISDKLTIYKKGKPCYRPTVHYAYMPCHETISSLHELRARNYKLQEKQRIMSDEITAGADILGALLMGHKYNSWWTGSILTIDEARRLVPHQNATTMQVAIGIVAAIMWMIEHPRMGVLVPDDLPHEYVLDIAKPYLGKLVSEASDWTPLSNYQVFFKENPGAKIDKKNIWSFKNFQFKP